MSFKGVEIEGTDAVGAGFQYPWEPEPRLDHKHSIDLGPFYIDRFPVTCGNYSTYLAATGYWPNDTHNFLNNWHGSTTCPPEMAKQPVVYVSQHEARLYCAWAGGRLPHSYEWQLAAQGTDGRKYPWGNTKNQSLFPPPAKGKIDLVNVDSFVPHDESTYGAAALVGHVWQWTDEFCDSHTCRASMRGGSSYTAGGSDGGWYFRQALELDKEQKYLTMSDSYDRVGTFGFRCVADAA